MNKALLALAALLPTLAWGQPIQPGFNYFTHNRQMIRNGVQAVLMCNGLFTSHRSLEQVFTQELAYLGGRRSDVPKKAYATAGNRGQYMIVVPSKELVIVRRGLDWGKQGFNRWDLTPEVLKAFRD